MKQVSYRLAEALENICKRKSLEHITVSEIAAEAGVTRQVFYHHFDDKFELASWIHYVHLYQSVKQAVEEQRDKQGQIWRGTMVNWLRCLEKNRELYANAFQSMSQKEFQRIIRDFFYACYQWQLEHHMQRLLNEEEKFALRSYCISSMELVCEWVSIETQRTPERMQELLELSMPEIIRKTAVELRDIPYTEAIKTMEEYLFKAGLSQAIF